MSLLDDFRFTDTDYRVPMVGTAVYLTVVFGLKALLAASKAPALELKWAFAAHNAVLCVASVAMFAGVADGIVRQWLRNGHDAFELYCDRGNQLNGGGRLWFWVYVFYLSKFYEFVDTLFLVLRQKPLTFLHVYHHASTVVVAYLGLYDNASYCWIAVFQNCFVHILMYYYYCVRGFGINPWWKRYLTVMQMIQFWINMIGLVAFAALRLSGVLCAGTWFSWAASFAINSSFYALFQLFYNETYTPAASSAASKKKQQ
jgi:hypothetical protein